MIKDQISVIYSIKHSNSIQFFLDLQKDVPIEMVEISGGETEDEIHDYFSNTTSKYVYVYTDGYVYAIEMLQELAFFLEQNENVDVAISPSSFLDRHKRIIARPFFSISESFLDCIYDGKRVVDEIEKSRINVIGRVGCCLFKVKTFQNMDVDMFYSLVQQNNDIKSLKSLFDTFNLKIGFIQESMCAERLVEAHETELKTAYEEWFFSSEKGVYEKSIEKEITFFYTDKGEYYNLLPIEQEAKKRGYSTKFTDKVCEKAEIGIYCQHSCHPENSKFSVILLHDMAQGHNKWPNLWEREPWNGFDIGVLPGKTWVELWKQCGEFYYANPRRGVYAMGYPKSDFVGSNHVKERASILKGELGLRYSFSVLYAPSWENDGKEHDFVSSLAELPVNLLIKQAHWPDKYQFVIDNIAEMRALHEGKYDNVYYISPEESIMTALEMCDMVVSDESSVMAEALLFDKISVAVVDWTIPSTIPPRLASVPMDYVIRCKKVELREYVQRIYEGQLDYSDHLEMGKRIFGNRGNVCRQIMNAIDYYLGYSDDDEFKEFRQIPIYLPCD